MTVLVRDDQSYMLEALALAARIPRRTWPNPPVGAVVVRDDGVVVGRGAHHGPGTPHAEVVALDEAGERARGATLYCTLEPCNHHGRTPPCAPRVVASGVRRLVVGVLDPNPQVAGGGVDVVQRGGVRTDIGIAGEDCLELIWPFVATRAFTRPFVLLKTATSLDGRFAPPPLTAGTVTAPVYLTGPMARRDVHRLRRWADLVLVGAGTVLSDRPALDGRLVERDDLCPTQDPLPGYVDTALRIDAPWPGRPHLAFGGCDSAGPERVRTIEAGGGTAVLCEEREGRVVPSSLLERLADVGVHAVLIEGGPRLARSFLSCGLVDWWVSYLAPRVLGQGPGWPEPTASPTAGLLDVPQFHLTRCGRVGADVRLVHDRLSFDDTLQHVTAQPKEA